MCSALVAGSSNQQVHLQRLLIDEVDKAFDLAVGDVLHLELQGVFSRLNAGDLAATHDPVRPLLLVWSEISPLVVLALVHLLNEFQSDDAIVGGASLGQKVVAVPCRLGEEGVDVFGVED